MRSNFEGGLPGIGIAADRLVLRRLPRIIDRRLLQGGLVGIVDRLLALRVVDGLARIAVAAGVEGVYSGDFGIRQDGTS
jgi:hypothetical protein